MSKRRGAKSISEYRPKADWKCSVCVAKVECPRIMKPKGWGCPYNVEEVMTVKTFKGKPLGDVGIALLRAKIIKK
jgi:hypothetical protein